MNTNNFSCEIQCKSICDYGSHVASFSPIATTDGWSSKPQPLLRRRAWAIQAANIKLVKDIIPLSPNRFICQVEWNFTSDYGSHVVSFSPIDTTDDWSSKPQPLLRRRAWAIQAANIKHVKDIIPFSPNRFICQVEWNFTSDYGSHVVSFSPIATTDDWSSKPQPLLRRRAWALQAANIKLVKDIIPFSPNRFICLVEWNFTSDYGSHVVSFSPIATTDGWSSKPHPLLKWYAWALLV